MTNAPVPGPSVFRDSREKIDQAHPLRTPLHYDQSKIGPRMDRLDAKTSYFADYIEHLEQRIVELERRIGAATS